VLLFLGAAFARGRWPATTGIQAAKLSDRFRRSKTSVAVAGKRAEFTAACLTAAAVEPLVAQAGQLTFALEGTSAKQHGPHFQKAGNHHNPTP